jgi:hypothetical protein
MKFSAIKCDHVFDVRSALEVKMGLGYQYMPFKAFVLAIRLPSLRWAVIFNGLWLSGSPERERSSIYIGI